MGLKTFIAGGLIGFCFGAYHGYNYASEMHKQQNMQPAAIEEHYINKTPFLFQRKKEEDFLKFAYSALETSVLKDNLKQVPENIYKTNR